VRLAEVNGGLLEPLTSYASAPNDIWSLGVILVNLVTSRNPFTTAQVSDPTFLAFLHNPDHLQSILPISDACNIVLKAALHPDSVERATVEELIELVKGVRRWTMSEEELMGASETARTAAVERGDERAIRAEERLRVRRVQEEMKRSVFPLYRADPHAGLVTDPSPCVPFQQTVPCLPFQPNLLSPPHPSSFSHFQHHFLN
jgi:serine/threonine protein kinase